MPSLKMLIKKLHHFFNKACSIIFTSVKIIFPPSDLSFLLPLLFQLSIFFSHRP